MSTDVYTVEVTRLRGAQCDLRVTCTQDGDQIDHAPEFALRLLDDPAGSPLQDARLYDPDWMARNFRRFLERVELLKRDRAGTWVVMRLHAVESELFAHLSKGMSWSTTTYPSDVVSTFDAAWSPDGKRVLLAQASGVARLTMVTKKGLGREAAFLNHWGLVAVGCSADGQRWLTVGRTQARWWDAKGKKVLEVRELGNIPANCAAVGDGDALITGHEDGVARRWSAEGALLKKVALGAPVTAVAWQAEGPAALATEDGGVWRWGDGGLVVLQGHEAPVRALAVRGEQVLSGGEDAVALWSQGDGELVTLQHERRVTASFYAPSLAPDGEELLFHSGSRVLAMNTEDGSFTTLSDDFDVNAACHGPDGTRLAERHDRGPERRVWSPDGELLRSLALGPTNLHRNEGTGKRGCAVLSPDGQWLAVPVQPTDYKQLELVLVDLQSGARRRFAHPKADYDFFNDLSFLDNTRVLIGGANYGHWIAHIDGAVELHPGDRIDRVARCPDGSGRYATSHDDRVKVRAADGQVLAEFRSHTPYGLHELLWSGDGQRLVAGAAGKLVVWEPDLAEPWVVAEDLGQFPALSPDGRWLLTQDRYDNYKALRLWDLRARALGATVAVDKHASLLAFAPDSQSLWWVGFNEARRYGLEGERLASFPTPPNTQEELPIVGVALLEDGRAFTAAEGDSRLRRWTAPGARKEDRAWSSRVEGAVPSPDGTRAVALCGWQSQVLALR